MISTAYPVGAVALDIDLDRIQREARSLVAAGLRHGWLHAPHNPPSTERALAAHRNAEQTKRNHAKRKGMKSMTERPS